MSKWELAQNHDQNDQEGAGGIGDRGDGAGGNDASGNLADLYGKLSGEADSVCAGAANSLANGESNCQPGAGGAGF